jgi:hypothetical protein
MRKGVILFFYGISLFLVIKEWYAKGNQGIVEPYVMAGPTYAFAILALMADFLGALPVVISAAATANYWRQYQADQKARAANQKNQPHSTDQNQPSTANATHNTMGIGGRY